MDFDKLEALAKAATPGPWSAEWVNRDQGYGDWHVATPDEEHPVVCSLDWQQMDAEYIAAANPQVVLELIGMLREAWAETDER